MDPNLDQIISQIHDIDELLAEYKYLLEEHCRRATDKQQLTKALQGFEKRVEHYKGKFFEKTGKGVPRMFEDTYRRLGIIVASYNDAQHRIVTFEDIPPHILRYYRDVINKYNDVMSSYRTNLQKEGKGEITPADIMEFKELVSTTSTFLDYVNQARRERFDKKEDKLLLYLLSSSSSVKPPTKKTQGQQQSAKRLATFKEDIEKPIMDLLIQILLYIPNTMENEPVEIFVVDTMNILRRRSASLRATKYSKAVTDDQGLRAFRETLEGEFQRYIKTIIDRQVKEKPNSFYIFTYPVFVDDDSSSLIEIHPPLTPSLLQSVPFSSASSSSSSGKVNPSHIYKIDINIKRDLKTLHFERAWDDHIIQSIKTFLITLKQLAMEKDFTIDSIRESLGRLGVDSQQIKKLQLGRKLFKIIHELKQTTVIIRTYDNFGDWMKSKSQGTENDEDFGGGGGGGGGGNGRGQSSRRSSTSSGGGGGGGGGGGRSTTRGGRGR